MPTVRWSEEAATDLVEIIDYIEQRNAGAARNLHLTIVQAAENLPQMPYLFRPGRPMPCIRCLKPTAPNFDPWPPAMG